MNRSILEKQVELQEGFSASAGMRKPIDLAAYATIGAVLDYIREMLYFMNEETVELMNEIGGSRDALKPWSSGYAASRQKRFRSTEHVKSEAIDMLCFSLNICMAAGITPENLDDEYNKVYLKNKRRQNNES